MIKASVKVTAEQVDRAYTRYTYNGKPLNRGQVIEVLIKESLGLEPRIDQTCFMRNTDIPELKASVKSKGASLQIPAWLGYTKDLEKYLDQYMELDRAERYMFGDIDKNTLTVYIMSPADFRSLMVYNTYEAQDREGNYKLQIARTKSLIYELNKRVTYESDFTYTAISAAIYHGGCR